MNPISVPLDNFDFVVTALSKAVGVRTVKRVKNRSQPPQIRFTASNKGLYLRMQSIRNPFPECLFDAVCILTFHLLRPIQDPKEPFLHEIGIGQLRRSIQHHIHLLFLFLCQLFCAFQKKLAGVLEVYPMRF